MTEFFQTRMGQQFYDGTMPRIAAALEAIATRLTEGDLPDLDRPPKLRAAARALVKAIGDHPPTWLQKAYDDLLDALANPTE